MDSVGAGCGGQQRAAERFGLDFDTFARGENELFSSQVLRCRMRQPGGGWAKQAGPAVGCR